jgi:alkanesulfonate monooxygenase SsuD/methylene tetrahydromethanopterin reductase-like flavin-dependent oxidoreductase (luciferase family)
VLIAHVAAHTESIRLGAGGVMLPNHSPLTIAEQFGTLETLHPGRIDLGLGRAPGSDQNTMRALRRDPMSADSFPQDVLELQGYLTGPTRIQGVEATPGKGTNVPLYILGSSLFGARLAAQLGLAVRVRLPLCPQRAAGCRGHLPPGVQALGAAGRAARDRRRERDRRRFCLRGAGHDAGHQACPRLPVLRRRAGSSPTTKRT